MTSAPALPRAVLGLLGQVTSGYGGPVTVASPITLLRDAAGMTLRQLFAGPANPPGPIPETVFSRDAGLFGPDSVTWQVHSHMSVLVGGFRSLLVQTLHPLAMAGVAGHSNYRSDPLGRLRRTANFVAATTFGTTSQAEAALNRVRRVHGQVRGTASDGRPYSASDPELLAWVHHVEVESFLLAYQRLGPGLGAREADRYVAEMAGLGTRLGVSDPITTAAALHAWVRNHPDRRVTTEARAAVRFLLAPPLPFSARGPYAVLLAGAISLIPVRDRLRLGLLLPGPIAGRLACEPAAKAMVAVLGWAMGPSPALASARVRLRA
jgi:uncharacterized protein (DUF2236 family)